MRVRGGRKHYSANVLNPVFRCSATLPEPESGLALSLRMTRRKAARSPLVHLRRRPSQPHRVVALRQNFRQSITPRPLLRSHESHRGQAQRSLMVEAERFCASRCTRYSCTSVFEKARVLLLRTNGRNGRARSRTPGASGPTRRASESRGWVAGITLSLIPKGFVHRPGLSGALQLSVFSSPDAARPRWIELRERPPRRRMNDFWGS